MSLRDARLASGLTQVAIAERWGRTQPQIVRLEKSDISAAKLSTIRSYVEALGGTCKIVVEVSGETFEM